MTITIISVLVNNNINIFYFSAHYSTKPHGGGEYWSKASVCNSVSFGANMWSLCWKETAFPQKRVWGSYKNALYKSTVIIIIKRNSFHNISCAGGGARTDLYYIIYSIIIIYLRLLLLQNNNQKYIYGNKWCSLTVICYVSYDTGLSFCVLNDILITSKQRSYYF